MSIHTTGLQVPPPPPQCPSFIPLGFRSQHHINVHFHTTGLHNHITTPCYDPSHITTPYFFTIHTTTVTIHTCNMTTVHSHFTNLPRGLLVDDTCTFDIS
ncbi:hypothetical protein Pmani_000555 [Petrolisthes manimaculis]|uniref:Uncharacterized protein n=1 Tax=Petrolisthes manimaculis TaxID=1843537 RepID=A0AAE1UQ77_9EUCA|nr:hypothetical protein Pmani_000555 [Petrolisthes manimaculis]